MITVTGTSGTLAHLDASAFQVFDTAGRFCIVPEDQVGYPLLACGQPDRRSTNRSAASGCRRCATPATSWSCTSSTARRSPPGTDRRRDLRAAVERLLQSVGLGGEGSGAGVDPVHRQRVSREVLAGTFDVPERELPVLPFTPIDPLIVPRVNPVDP